MSGLVGKILDFPNSFLVKTPRLGYLTYSGGVGLIVGGLAGYWNVPHFVGLIPLGHSWVMAGLETQMEMANNRETMVNRKKHYFNLAANTFTAMAGYAAGYAFGRYVRNL